MKKSLALSLSTLALISSTAVMANSVEEGAQEVKDVQNEQMKMVSKDMKVIMERLESDWEFIGNFLNNPSETIAQFELSDAEKEALSARNLNALMNLGLSDEEVTVAMSGTHRGGGKIGAR